jgi:hypothetical protein
LRVISVRKGEGQFHSLTDSVLSDRRGQVRLGPDRWRALRDTERSSHSRLLPHRYERYTFSHFLQVDSIKFEYGDEKLSRKG